MILLVLILTILCTLSYFYLDIKQNITLFLSPFTAFTFSGQSAYSSVFGGEAPILFFLCIVQKPITNGAYRLYEQCLAEVSTVLTIADMPCYFSSAGRSPRMTDEQGG